MTGIVSIEITGLIIFVICLRSWCTTLEKHKVLGYSLKSAQDIYLMEKVSGWCIPKIFHSRKEAEKYNVDSGLKYFTVPLYKYEYDLIKCKDYSSYGRKPQ
jgi:hypothetical protein